jgi:hypothetical protein
VKIPQCAGGHRLPGANKKRRDLAAGNLVPALAAPKMDPKAPARMRHWYPQPPRTVFAVSIDPHAYRVYRIEQ